ncbi:hypothetical protein A3D11_02320 [Candidatus Peribacteria bacterium RIFCSPHIGHO2_02_FULL_49_16]|nr:MAG: hypothetical protein A2880_03780 [Candidatus Peribacteria bacterium RIFCSPHIGHO2_01_FULL_49_38]OGJ59961.1 MAG: hypothetical protein A3D11_02320 [Candidatus Peribacteria bacterium RIFCSPHIGHO2_02_FULL_49_16]
MFTEFRKVFLCFFMLPNRSQRRYVPERAQNECPFLSLKPVFILIAIDINFFFAQFFTRARNNFLCTLIVSIKKMQQHKKKIRRILGMGFR